MVNFLIPRFLLALSGFDKRIVAYLQIGTAIQLYLLSFACAAVAAMTSFGFFYISQISESNIYLSALLAAVCFTFCLNLFRMINAGGSYPVGFAQQDIQSWRPSVISLLVIVFVGSLLTMPCAIYFHNNILISASDDIVGLVANWNAMVSHPQQAIFSIALLSVLFSSFYWLRYVFINAVRQYEILSWSVSRQLVNDTQQQFSIIANTEFYSNQKSAHDPEKHFSDPPYNYQVKFFNTSVNEVVAFSNFSSEAEENENQDQKRDEAIGNDLEDQDQAQSVEVGQYPEYFKEVARSVLFGSNTHLKEDLVAYLRIEEFILDQRILHSDIDETLESVFNFELENHDIIKKYPASFSTINPLSQLDFSGAEFDEHRKDLACPVCAEKLTVIKTVSDPFHHCKACSASLYSTTQMNNFFGQEFNADFFKNRVYTLYQGPEHKKSPINDDYLEKYTVLSPTSTQGYGENELLSNDVDLLVSKDYQYIWLSDKDSQSLVDSLQVHQQRKSNAENRPFQLGYYLLQLLTAIPFEVYNPIRKIPVALVSIIALMSVIFFVQLQNLPISSSPFLLYPNVFLDKPLTLITNTLMHANFQHLLGNVLFLWVFADNIEDKYGSKAFLSIFFLTGICGSLLHVAFNLQSNAGLLGASGGVYGIMGAYFVLYKQVNVWWVVAFIRFKVSIIFFALFRVAMDVYGIFFSDNNIAWFAHIGGFFAGTFLAFLIKHQFLKKIVFHCFASDSKSIDKY